jgi:hypothetical protein
MRLKAMLSAAVLAVGICMPVMADVTGKVTLEGKAPENKKLDLKGDAKCAALHKDPMFEENFVVGKDNALRDVVVVVTNPPRGGAVPAEPVTLDQKGCKYTPHVLAAMVGQKFVVKNSDPFMHNVHGFPENNSQFNFAQNTIDPGKNTGPFKKSEEDGFLIKCDVHGWMNARMYVFDHPYFAVTDENGAFAIKGLKDGSYTVVAKHFRWEDPQEGKLTVKGGKGTVDFKFSADDLADASGTPPVIPVAGTKTVSLTEKKSCCQEKGTCAKPTSVVSSENKEAAKAQ